MSPNVGLNVLEVDGLAAPTVTAAPTSVGAFVGITERGVPNSPVRVTSPAAYRDRFGLARSDGLLSYALDGFFGNGGREAYVTRVVGAGSTAARTTLDNRAAVAAPSLLVAAGYRGHEDPGAWGERVRVDVRDDPRVQTKLSADTSANATGATLQSVAGVSVGSVLRFVAGATTLYRKVVTVDTTMNQVTWAGAIAAVLSAASTVVSTAEFRLAIRYRPSTTADERQVEDWRNLSMETGSADYAVDRVNHALTGSRYVTVVDLSGTAASGDENPKLVSSQPLVASSESVPSSTEFLGDSASGTGLHAFDVVEVQLVAAPDAHLLSAPQRDSVVQTALDYCATRGDCMYVGSAPDRGRRPGVTVPRALSDYAQLESAYAATTLTSYGRKFQAAKVFGAVYAPWVRVADESAAGPAPTRFVPAEGHVMGIYARTERERGIFKAPAGSAAGVRGALDVAATFDDIQHDGLVRNATINGIRREAGLGITVAASRTLSTDTRWWFVSVRLLFNFVKSSLRESLRFVRQEPHTDALRRTVVNNVVRPFLLGLWRQGAFGSDPADDVFTIKCDAENNPPNEVDLGNFKLEVYVYPVKPAETVLIVVGQQPSASTASES
jgi:phage tail sheath protein FI